MDENDSLSEWNKIRLGHSRTNGAIWSKINFKIEIYSALSIFDSHVTLHSPCEYYPILITTITTVFITRLTKTTSLIVTNNCAQWLLVLTLYVNHLRSICEIIVTMKIKGLYNI